MKVILFGGTGMVGQGTRLYNVLYPFLYPLMLVVKLVAPKHITTTEHIGQAMLRIARNGFPKKVLGNQDINAAALR
jgi:hypothetical protein